MSSWSFDHDLEAIVAAAEADLETLRGARVFVTGGTGFVGTWMLAALRHADRRLGLDLNVAVLTRNPTGFAARQPDLADWAALIAGDVTEVPPLPDVDAVIHAATPASAAFNDTNPDLMRTTIVAGMESVLAAIGPRPDVPMLFTSSGAVYGPQPLELEQLPETHEPEPGAIEPRNAYALGKRDAEAIAIAAADSGGPSLRLARLFAFAGPLLPLDAHFAIGNFIGDAVAGRTIHIAGDGTAVRSYLYAGDMVVQLLGVLTRATPSRAYNVGADQAIDIADLAHLVADVIDPTCTVEIAGRAQGALPTSAGSRYVPSIERMRHELKIEPTVSLAEAIARSAAAAH